MTINAPQVYLQAILILIQDTVVFLPIKRMDLENDPVL